MKKLLIKIAKILLLLEPRARRRERQIQQRLDALHSQNTEQPLVSVLLPVYNVEAYIEKCLESILTQSYRNIEVICVNDSSTDGSLSALTEAAKRDERVQVIDKSENEGLPQARRTALSAAMGDYVLNVDSDDWLESTMVEDLMLLAQAEQADMVYCDYFRNGAVVRVAKIPEKSALLRVEKCSFAFGNTIWNRLIKREVLEKVDFPRTNMGEDLVINTQLYYYANKIFHCPKPLYHHTYLENQGSISAASSEKNFMEILENYQRVHDFCQRVFGTQARIDRLYEKRVAHIEERRRKVSK